MTKTLQPSTESLKRLIARDHSVLAQPARTLRDAPTLQFRPVRVPLDIERLLQWVYMRQRAHVIVGRGVGLQRMEMEADGIEYHETSKDGIAAVERAAMQGAIISGSGMGSVTNDLHPDAEATHRAVMALGGRASGLVIEHALKGQAPDWMRDDVPRYLPAWPDGRSRRGDAGEWRSFTVHREYDANRNVKRAWCPVLLVNDPAVVKVARLRYALWREALACLSGYLGQGPRLTHHRVDGALPSAEPWTHPR